MTQNALQVFSYKNKEVRTMEIDGEVWFVAKDVALALEYKDTDQAVRTHVAEEDKLTRDFYGTGQKRAMIVINESGVYALIFSSTLPSAKEFKYWVTHEVLPAIRKTGSYSVQPNTVDLELRHKELDAKNRELDLRGAELLQHMIDSPAYPITDESKAILAHEISKLITGHDNRSMLPVVKQAMYSAIGIGAMFNVSKNKIDKIANTHGLKPPIGETNEYGTWIRTKSPHSAHECPQFMYNNNALDWFTEYYSDKEE